MSNILIVDDEKEIADLLEVYLNNENYNNHSDIILHYLLVI